MSFRFFIVTLSVQAAASGMAATPDADAQLSQKLNHYIDCINSYSVHVSKSQARYLQWIKDPRVGPTGRERVGFGPFGIDDPSHCAAGIAAAEKASPSVPDLERQARVWLAALESLRAMSNEAQDYYDLRNYEDDGMRRGQELHPRLMAAFAQFAEADGAFAGAVHPMSREIGNRELAGLAADPEQRLGYLVLATVRSAGDTLRFARPAGDPIFDAAAFQAALSSFEDLRRQLDDLIETPSKREELSDAVVLSGIRNFGRSATQFLRTAKELARMHRDGKHYDSVRLEGNLEWLDGHPARLLREHNELVKSFNLFQTIYARRRR